MFFILSKILAFLITPVIWVMALLIYSFIQKDDRKRRRSILLTTLIFYLLCNSFIFNECMRAWEVPAIKENEISSSYDAVIVMGGMSSYDTKLERLQFGRGNDRLLQAVSLYKKGIARKIFFTGGSGSITFPDMKEAVQIKRYLSDIGIPPDDVIIENESRNTRENAVFSKPLLDKHFPAGRFIMITSAFHIKRASGALEKVGIKADVFSTDRYSGPRRYELDFLFMPSAEVLYNWTNLIHEIAGYLTYKALGYI